MESCDKDLEFLTRIVQLQNRTIGIQKRVIADAIEKGCDGHKS